jgi:hypothetical protein
LDGGWGDGRLLSKASLDIFSVPKKTRKERKKEFGNCNDFFAKSGDEQILSNLTASLCFKIQALAIEHF